MLKKRPVYVPPSRVVRQNFITRVRALGNAIAGITGHAVDINEIIKDLGRGRITDIAPGFDIFPSVEETRRYQVAIARRFNSVCPEFGKAAPDDVKICYRGLLHVHAVVTVGGRAYPVRVVDTTLFKSSYVLPVAKNHQLTGRHLRLVVENLQILNDFVRKNYQEPRQY